MNAEQFREFMGGIQELVKGRQSSGGEREFLNFKIFSGLEKFGGEEAKWKEWFFNFKIAFGGHGLRYKTVLSNIEKDKTAVGAKETIDSWRGHATNEGFLDWFDKVGGELFNKLCLSTSGEANLLVRGSEEQNGWMAFRRLRDRYDGKNPTSMIRKLTEVICPGVIKGVREVFTGLERWEQKVKDWEVSFGEVISEKIKLSILIGMVPKELQDEAFRASEEPKYGEVKDLFFRISRNRAEKEMPRPMDIGRVGQEEEEQCFRCGEDWEVGWERGWEVEDLGFWGDEGVGVQSVG